MSIYKKKYYSANLRALNPYDLVPVSISVLAKDKWEAIALIQKIIVKENYKALISSVTADDNAIYHYDKIFE